MSRYLLELQDEDGQVMAEVIYSHADSSGLVDADGLPLSYGQTIALYGREWRVQTAERATTFIRIICEAVTTDAEEERMPRDRVDHERPRGTRLAEFEARRGVLDEP